jgi:ppGpp synthetase/RelA/SpoT-type nucleotidyltranferase
MKVTFTKSQLKKVGEKLRHAESLSENDEMILAEFRIGHRSIIESFRNHHNTILEKTKWKDRGILFASRLKKRQTLIHKLASRQQQMDLSRMHDIAGCRLIFLKLKDLNEYRNRFVDRLHVNRHFVRLYNDGRHDYITKPRTTGYRGIHDVYEEVTNDTVKAKIEVQYRTITQHAWATALEIWDQTHLHGAKFGLEDPSIQYLFSLYAELLWRFIDCDDIHSRKKLNLSDEGLYDAIREYERKFKVLSELSKMQRIQTRIRLTADEVLLHRYSLNASWGNTQPLLEARKLSWDMINDDLFEHEISDTSDFVFVQTNPKFLKRAYNNYFDDARGFVKRVRSSMVKLHGSRRFQVFRRPLDEVFLPR